MHFQKVVIPAEAVSEGSGFLGPLGHGFDAQTLHWPMNSQFAEIGNSTKQAIFEFCPYKTSGFENIAFAKTLCAPTGEKLHFSKNAFRSRGVAKNTQPSKLCKKTL